MTVAALTLASVSWPAALAARPLLVDDRHAEQVREAWLRFDAEPLAAVNGASSDAARYRVDQGFAVIPVSGALINRGNLIGDGYYATSYAALTQEVERAAADPAIFGIVLAVNSPGGQADGILRPAAAIRAARARKPVMAVVGSIAASGGYWLAAQADEIWLNDDFSTVGSIGVYSMHMDVSGYLEKAGIDISVIHSGRNKVDGHPFAPLPDDVRAAMQQSNDDLRLIFAREIEAGRPALKADAALATEAKTYPALNPRTGARPAIEEKLADRMGGITEAITARRMGGSRRISTMDTITKADHDKAVADARTEGHAAGKAEGIAEGRKAGLVEGTASAVARIEGIVGSDEAKGREGLAAHFAYKTAMSVDDAKAALAASAAGTTEAGAGSPLAAAMRAQGRVETGTPPGHQASTQKTIDTAGIYAARAKPGQ